MHIDRLKIRDFLSGKESGNYLAYFRETQWYKEEAVIELQVLKLKKLFGRIKNSSPYYGEIIKNYIDIDNIKDLSCLKYFPVTDKQILKNNYDQILNSNIESIKGVTKGWTGGTTGEPLILYKDLESRAASKGFFYRFYDWMDVRFGEPVIVVWGNSMKEKSLKVKMKNKVSGYLENIKRIGAYELDEANIRRNIDLFNRHKPVLIRGYGQAIKDIALSFSKHGYTYPLKAVSTTVDTLFENDRQLFREVFGCETFDQYGCGEVGSIAYECEAHQGLHITNERCIVETNEEGELIVTDLDNYVLPIIRYKNGDIVEIDDTPCSCGRYGKKIKNIHGRKGDIIMGINGKKIHPVFFNNILNDSHIGESRTIKKYKVIQHDHQTLEWKIVCDDLTEADMQYMKKVIWEHAGNMNITITKTNHIPAGKNGKYRFVESKI